MVDDLELVVERSRTGNSTGANAEFTDLTVQRDNDILTLRFPIEKFEFITLTP